MYSAIRLSSRQWCNKVSVQCSNYREFLPTAVVVDKNEVVHKVRSTPSKQRVESKSLKATDRSNLLPLCSFSCKLVAGSFDLSIKIEHVHFLLTSCFQRVASTCCHVNGP